MIFGVELFFYFYFTLLFAALSTSTKRGNGNSSCTGEKINKVARVDQKPVTLYTAIFEHVFFINYCFVWSHQLINQLLIVIFISNRTLPRRMNFLFSNVYEIKKWYFYQQFFHPSCHIMAIKKSVFSEIEANIMNFRKKIATKNYEILIQSTIYQENIWLKAWVRLVS